jgi:UDP-glucose 4-epimerase
MTKVLVTGAGGFVGTALIPELSLAGFKVRALLRSSSTMLQFSPEVDVVVGDVCDERQVKEAMVDCDAVVHLAAKVHAMDDHDYEREYDAVNVEGTRHVLDAAVACGATRVVFMSSAKVFGEETQGCVDETSPPNPQTSYGWSKWKAEQLVSEYSQRGDMAAVSLRLPMVYGQTKKGNLFRMIAAIDAGRFPPLPQLPALRSLLHVDNCVQAVIRCLHAPRFDRTAYIVADAAPYSVTDLYDRIRVELGKGLPRWRIPIWVLKGGARCGDLFQATSGKRALVTTEHLMKLIGNAWYTPTALMRDLGYRPSYSFEETVSGLIEFYRRSIGMET